MKPRRWAGAFFVLSLLGAVAPASADLDTLSITGFLPAAFPTVTYTHRWSDQGLSPALRVAGLSLVYASQVEAGGGLVWRLAPNFELGSVVTMGDLVSASWSSPDTIGSLTAADWQSYAFLATELTLTWFTPLGDGSLAWGIGIKKFFGPPTYWANVPLSVGFTL